MTDAPGAPGAAAGPAGPATSGGGWTRGRRLGLDVGTARIGVASCDPDGILATPVETIKVGRSGTPVALGPAEDDQLRWGDDDLEATLAAPGARWTASPDGTASTAAWSVVIPAHGTVEVTWQLRVTDGGGVVVAARNPWRPGRAQRNPPAA